MKTDVLFGVSHLRYENTVTLTTAPIGVRLLEADAKREGTLIENGLRHRDARLEQELETLFQSTGRQRRGESLRARPRERVLERKVTRVSQDDRIIVLPRES